MKQLQQMMLGKLMQKKEIRSVTLCTKTNIQIDQKPETLERLDANTSSSLRSRGVEPTFLNRNLSAQE